MAYGPLTISDASPLSGAMPAPQVQQQQARAPEQKSGSTGFGGILGAALGAVGAGLIPGAGVAGVGLGMKGGQQLGDALERGFF